MSDCHYQTTAQEKSLSCFFFNLKNCKNLSGVSLNSDLSTIRHRYLGVGVAEVEILNDGNLGVVPAHRI